MTVGDIEAMGAAMAQSLAKSDAIRDRSPDSPMWIVSIEKVTNLSSDVMTSDEQWGIMARLQSSLPIREMWDTKTLRLVIPPERVEQLRQSPDHTDFHEGFGTQREVTHTMAATFRSMTRAEAKDRSDLYYCEFQMIDLRTGEPVWNDRFEYKRAAQGHVWD